jgi:hypothetical protein
VQETSPRAQIHQRVTEPHTASRRKCIRTATLEISTTAIGSNAQVAITTRSRPETRVSASRRASGGVTRGEGDRGCDGQKRDDDASELPAEDRPHGAACVANDDVWAEYGASTVDLGRRQPPIDVDA